MFLHRTKFTCAAAYQNYRCITDVFIKLIKGKDIVTKKKSVNNKRNKESKQIIASALQVLNTVRSVVLHLCHLYSLYSPLCFSLSFCLTVGAIVWPAVTDVLYCCFSA